MGTVNTSSTGKLYFDFRYKNQRCREYTKLPDTPANRRRMGQIIQRIDAEITLGSFDYAAYFPESKKAQQFALPETPQGAIPLFKQFAQLWYANMKMSWRDSYQTTVETIVVNRLIPHFGKLVVSSIKKQDIVEFRTSLAKVITRNKTPLSAHSINRHIKILYAILNDAADQFEFTSIATLKPLKEQKTDIYPLTLSEVRRFLDAVRQDFKPYYTVRFFTGMRTGEIDGLQWKYVDFTKRQILIRETWVKGKVEYTKTDASQREIQMTEPVYQALKRQFEATGQQKWVFCNSAGNPLEHHNVSKRVWYPMLKLLKLQRRTPYQTRHTAATLMLASGETPEFIANQLGHANTSMLFKVYSRYVPNLTRQDGSAFGKLLQENL